MGIIYHMLIVNVMLCYVLCIVVYYRTKSDEQKWWWFKDRPVLGLWAAQCPCPARSPLLLHQNIYHYLITANVVSCQD